MADDTSPSTPPEDQKPSQSDNILTSPAKLAESLSKVGEAVKTDTQLLAVLVVGIIVVAIPAMVLVIQAANSESGTPGVILIFVIWLLTVVLISGLFVTRFSFKENDDTRKERNTIRYDFRGRLRKARETFVQLSNDVQPLKKSIDKHIQAGHITGKDAQELTYQIETLAHHLANEEQEIDRWLGRLGEDIDTKKSAQDIMKYANASKEAMPQNKSSL